MNEEERDKELMVMEILEAKERELQVRIEEVRELRAVLSSHERLPMPIRQVRRPSTNKRGAMSQAEAALAVLKEARGEGLHADVIASRAAEKGAVFGTGNPGNQVDLLLYRLMRERGEPIEKVMDGTKTWRWTKVEE